MRGGQRLFVTFPKICPSWYCDPSLMANTFLRRVTFQNSAFVPYVLCKLCPASAPRFSWNSSEKMPKEIAELLFQVDSAFQQIEPMRQLKAENFYNCICLLASVGYWFPNLPNIICNYKFPWCLLFKPNHIPICAKNRRNRKSRVCSHLYLGTLRNSGITLSGPPLPYVILQFKEYLGDGRGGAKNH